MARKGQTAVVEAPDPVDAGPNIPTWGDVLGSLVQRVPPDLRQRFLAEAEAGRAAAATGRVDHESSEVPAAENVLELQRKARRSALDGAVPPNREAARAGLSSLDGDQYPERLRLWLDDPDARTLVLAGKTGAGKSQAAYAVACEAATTGAATRHRGAPVRRELLIRAWTVNGYIAELRPDGSPDPQWKIRDRARTAQLLVLDDLGAETDTTTTEHVRRELVELIDYRLEHMLRTVITTNLPSSLILERFGDRLLSRLTENATGLRFLGDDRRRLAADPGW